MISTLRLHICIPSDIGGHANGESRSESTVDFENRRRVEALGDLRVLPDEILCAILVNLTHGDIARLSCVSSKKQFEYQKARTPLSESSSFMRPYIVTKRCRGKIFAELRDTLSSEEALNLASFLGEQLCNLHLLPCPSPQDAMLRAREGQVQLSYGDGLENISTHVGNPVEWKLFISVINQKRKDVNHRLTAWGDPIPSKLIEKVDDYIPRDLSIFIDIFENAAEACKSCTWIHMDVMDDNIYMTASCSASISGEIALILVWQNVVMWICMSSIIYRSSRKIYSWYPSHILDFSDLSKIYSWYPSHILDFSDLSIVNWHNSVLRDPLFDLIPIYLDVFRGDYRLLNHFLDKYRRPFFGKESLKSSVDDSRFGRLSYRAM